MNCARGVWRNQSRPADLEIFILAAIALYKRGQFRQMNGMDFENPILWIVAAVVAVTVIVLFVAPRFSTAARLERRRRKSNARVVNKSNRPTVKFSVRTKDSGK